MSLLIVPDAARYDAPLENVLTAAFGPGRFAKVSERVREFAVHDRALSRVALRDNAVVGCCRIYRIAVGDVAMLFLGPLAVAPDAQGERLGVDLVEASLAACAQTSANGVIVVGQPRMFAPFGFGEIPKDRVVMPGPVEARRLQWLAWREGALQTLSGAVRAPRAAS